MQNCHGVGNQWAYFSEGEEHFILHYTGEEQRYKGHVLILQKEYETYNGKELKDIGGGLTIQQQLRDHHVTLYSKLNCLQPFLLKQRQLQIIEPDKTQMVEQLQHIIQQHNGQMQGKKNKYKRTGIRKQTPFIIGRNLFYDRQLAHYSRTVWLEFKLKSDIPDSYTPQWLEHLTKKYRLEQCWLIQLVEQSPLAERTKEFKKRLRQHYEVTNKISPLDMFAYKSKDFLGQSRIVKYSDKGSQLPITGEEFDSVVNSVLKRSGLVRAVLLLQLLYDQPMDILQDQDFLQLAHADKQLVDHLDRVTSKLGNQLNKTSHEYVEGSHLTSKPIREAIPQQDLIEMFFRLLIAMTWRDVSVIVEVGIVSSNQSDKLKENSDKAIYKQQVNQRWWVEITMTLIDYELKSVSRIPYYLEKDQLLMKLYIQSKLHAKIPDCQPTLLHPLK